MEGTASFLLVLLGSLLVCSENTAASETAVQSKDKAAFVNASVALPCHVDQKQCGNLHSVKWYKDTSRIYVYSQAGNVTRAEGDATSRMNVSYRNDSTEAWLMIDPVRVQDEATYKCEITYLEVRESCDVVQIVKLKTLVAPKSVILKADDVTMKNDSVLGPKEEGEEVDLTCEASGRPTPVIKWFRGSTEEKRAESLTRVRPEDGEGESTRSSTLKLSLQRSDLNAIFECKVYSEALEEPIVSWITADIHVKPTDIEISGVKDYVLQGTNVLLMCDVYGARPAATVRWMNGSQHITDENLVQTSPQDNPVRIRNNTVSERDGTFTTKSQLEFRATHWENGARFHCYAENNVTKNRHEPELHQVLIVQVRYPPVVSVKPKYITVRESDRAMERLFCSYQANPQELKEAFWSKNGRNLTMSEENNKKLSGGTIMNLPLIISNISREDMGEYACFLRNDVGSGRSDDNIFLNVQYAPDVEVVMDPPTPVKALDKKTVMLTCNVTDGNPSNLSTVRWFLDGELMKQFPECSEGVEGGGPFCGLDPTFLSLEQVDETFAGNYTCQGENIDGWGPESEPQELIVYYPPSPAKLRYYPSKVVKGGSITLECNVDNTGRPDNVTYRWFMGGHPRSDKASILHISPVGLVTRNNFTCLAENEGGQSESATVFINVNAPPAIIINKLGISSYQGVLYNSPNVNLTCRVECYPLCDVIWKKDEHILNTETNPLYYVITRNISSEMSRNIFESVESTLVWNMTAWPEQKLNKNSNNSIYTCESSTNTVGDKVSYSVEVAVDYPPENVTATPLTVNVVEGQRPGPVKCHGKGRPTLTYQWKRNSTYLPGTGDELRLGNMKRSDAGRYMCEASNRHGNQTAVFYVNVLYPPKCTLTRTKKDGNDVLLCTATGNPSDIRFTWKVLDSNKTESPVNSMDVEQDKEDHLKSYLIIDSSMDAPRFYRCYASNTIEKTGYTENICEVRVEGIVPWWNRLGQEKLIIIIASIVAVIICVIIICIVIILLCRRKRASTKSPNTQSSLGDKNQQGAAPPVGYTADPLLNNQDKEFYENLPFHGLQNPPNKNAFYTLTTPYCKQTVVPPQYSATIPHHKHSKLIPKSLFQEQLPKSKSFSSKSKQKKHFQIPLQKCHSFKFQTAESYFQPIKNIHEENLMRNGYVSDYPSSSHELSHHKREKHKQKTIGPLVLRRPSDYQGNAHFPANMQNSVQLQYPQPVLSRPLKATNKPNGVVYADLDMSKPSNRKSSHASNTNSKSKKKSKTEYATLKFNDVGQEIDV